MDFVTDLSKEYKKTKQQYQVSESCTGARARCVLGLSRHSIFRSQHTCRVFLHVCVVSGIRQTIQDGHQDQAALLTCITTSKENTPPFCVSRIYPLNDLLLYVTCIALVACAFKSCLCVKFQILDLHAIFCAASACRR